MNDNWPQLPPGPVRKMPKQKPHRSVQDVGTPDWFIADVEKAYGKIVLDVAASERNHVCDQWLGVDDNSLSMPFWKANGLIWCNPPYEKIAPWVELAKKSAARGYRVAVLVPASVGTVWWAKHVDGDALCVFIRPRLIFKGHLTPYPKDLALLIYDQQIPTGYKCVDVVSGGL
jgi:phage N-6-adenine-methyltransferase